MFAKKNTSPTLTSGKRAQEELHLILSGAENIDLRPVACILSQEAPGPQQVQVVKKTITCRSKSVIREAIWELKSGIARVLSKEVADPVNSLDFSVSCKAILLSFWESINDGEESVFNETLMKLLERLETLEATTFLAKV